MAISDDADSARTRRSVLNAGCGSPASNTFRRGFSAGDWEVVRFDISPAVQPDVLGSFTDMGLLFEDRRFDAVWTSHSLEHLQADEVHPALLEFRRILKPTGFALVTCPNLTVVASLLLEKGLHHIAYESLAGPISVHDMMFGHSASIAAGDVHMAHHTGFDQDSLGAAALKAGFAQALVGSDDFNLWAAFLLPETDLDLLRGCLTGTLAEFLLSPDPTVS